MKLFRQSMIAVNKFTAISVLSIPVAWILALHIFQLLTFHSLPGPVEVLKNLSLSERYLAIWFANSDAVYYLEIAKNWYGSTSPVFFPGWSLLISLTGKTMLGTKILATLITVTFFYLLPSVIKKLGFANKFKTEELMLLMISFPGMLSVLVPMTEPIFLLLVSLIIISTESNKLKISAFLIGLASAVRPNGFILVLYLIFYIIYKRVPLKQSWFLIPISLSGIIFYFSFLYFKFGSIAIYFDEQRKWSNSLSVASIGRFFTDQIEAVQRLLILRNLEPINIYHQLAIVFFICLATIGFKKLPKPIWLYSVAIVLLPMFSGSHAGVSRYILAAFPLFLPLMEFLSKNKFIYYLMVICGFLLQAYMFNRFLNFEAN